MSIRRILLLVAVFATTLLSASAQKKADNSINNPMTRAVLNAYEKMLANNPSDYETYFNRAREYYRHDEYIRALDDINNALKYTPVNATQMRYDELMLRASILEQSNRPDQALSDLNQAIALQPNDFVTLYRKANIEYTLEQYTAAKADYAAMLRLNSRSPEALIGLARVAVKENNLGLANDYLDRAVQFDSNNSETYLRRASVRRAMANHNGAVDDIILALSLSSDNKRAIEALVEYADVNYSAVMTALSRAISTAPKAGMYRYLRAVIAQAHYHYTDAITDYEVILNQRLFDYYGLYASIATCQYYIGEFETALSNIDKAIRANADNIEYLLTRSRIKRALGYYDQALQDAAKASVIKSGSPDALVQMGLCYVSKGEYDQAASLFGEATLTDTQNPYFYMLRAWLLERHLNQPVAASQFYAHVLSIDALPEYDIKSLKEFAYLFRGDSNIAIAWMDNALATYPDHDGLANYYAACLYAQMGDFDAALPYVEQSLKNGYANYYDWMYNTDARINTAPLRDDLRYLNLLNRYNHLFGRQ